MRGKGKKKAMVHVNLRLPMEVLAYFQEFPSYTVEMRNVLQEYVEQQDREDLKQGMLMMMSAIKEELTK